MLDIFPVGENNRHEAFRTACEDSIPRIGADEKVLCRQTSRLPKTFLRGARQMEVVTTETEMQNRILCKKKAI